MAVPNEINIPCMSQSNVDFPRFLTTKTLCYKNVFINIVQIEHNFNEAECFSTMISVRVYFAIESEMVIDMKKDLNRRIMRP